jgi:hypothetical protein
MIPAQVLCPIGHDHEMRPGDVLCAAHWSRVPVAYRRQIRLRAEQVERALSGQNAALMAARMRLYRQACAQAIEAVQPRAAGVAQ